MITNDSKPTSTRRRSNFKKSQRKQKRKGKSTSHPNGCVNKDKKKLKKIIDTAEKKARKAELKKKQLQKQEERQKASESRLTDETSGVGRASDDIDSGMEAMTVKEGSVEKSAEFKKKCAEEEGEKTTGLMKEGDARDDIVSEKEAETIQKGEMEKQTGTMETKVVKEEAQTVKGVNTKSKHSEKRMPKEHKAVFQSAENKNEKRGADEKPTAATVYEPGLTSRERRMKAVAEFNEWFMKPKAMETQGREMDSNRALNVKEMSYQEEQAEKWRKANLAKEREQEEFDNELAEVRPHLKRLLSSRLMSQAEEETIYPFLDRPHIILSLLTMMRNRQLPAGKKQSKRRCQTCEDEVGGIKIVGHRSQDCSIRYIDRLTYLARRFGNSKCRMCGFLITQDTVHLCKKANLICTRCPFLNKKTIIPHAQFTGVCQSTWKFEAKYLFTPSFEQLLHETCFDEGRALKVHRFIDQIYDEMREQSSVARVSDIDTKIEEKTSDTAIGREEPEEYTYDDTLDEELGINARELRLNDK